MPFINEIDKSFASLCDFHSDCPGLLTARISRCGRNAKVQQASRDLQWEVDRRQYQSRRQELAHVDERVHTLYQMKGALAPRASRCASAACAGAITYPAKSENPKVFSAVTGSIPRFNALIIFTNSPGSFISLCFNLSRTSGGDRSRLGRSWDPDYQVRRYFSRA